jgi:hypothetical protein
MSNELTLSIDVWVHAHFETGKPVEVDVQRFYGEFDVGLVNFLLDRESVDLLECLEILPTEDWLHVDIVATVEDGQWWFTTGEYKRMFDWDEIQKQLESKEK